MAKQLALLVIATLCATAMYAGVGVSPANAAAGDTYNLGTLGGTNSRAYAVNTAGQVAGESATVGFGTIHAFRFSGSPGNGGKKQSM